MATRHEPSGAQSARTCQGGTRVLIVEDHELMRRGLRELIEQQKDYVVVAEAASIEEARSTFLKCQPDLVTMDLNLPDGNALALIREFSERSPQTKVLVISINDEYLYADLALKAGAKGYLRKVAVERVIEAIECIMHDKIYVSGSADGTVCGETSS